MNKRMIVLILSTAVCGSVGMNTYAYETEKSNIEDNKAVIEDIAEGNVSLTEDDNEVESINVQSEDADTDMRIATESSGKCGDNLTWTLDDNGTLTISGTGAMSDYTNYINYSYNIYSPWYNNRASITEVIIDDGVTRIGSEAFYGCSGLTSITIPGSVTSIGNSTFSSCSGLSNVTIPSNVKSIGDRAFSGCINLNTVYYNAINCSTMGYDRAPVFQDCSNLKTLYIGDNVTTIPDYAFKSCAGLTSITIPDSVTSIGKSAFDGCKNLNAVHITDIAAWCGISFGSEYANPLYYAHDLYLNNALITELVIPDSVTGIGDYAFYSCAGLTSITIPGSVTSIGNSAFSGCSGLSNVTISSNVKSIGERAFSGCTNLNTVYYNAVNCSTMGYDLDPIFQYCSNLKTLYIGDNVTTIPDYAFYGCSGLTSITIPDSVTSIGNCAFEGCSFNDITSFVIPDSVEIIGVAAFGKMPNLVSITLPLGGNALNKIFQEIPDTLTRITLTSGDVPEGFAANRTNVARVNIGSEVTSIGKDAFNGCTNLRYITIEEGVSSIWQTAFGGCTSLSEVTIPRSVTSIVGAGVFPKNTVIKGYKNSAAQIYAEDYGYKFIEITDEGVLTTSSASRIGSNIVISTIAEDSITDKLLHIALFDSKNIMIDYIAVPTTISDKSAYVVFKDNAQAQYARVFVWDSLTNMIPEGKAEKVNIN